MSPSAETPLDESLEALAAYAKAIPSVNNSLFMASLFRSTKHPDIFERSIVKRCNFDWTFHLTQKSNRMLFLFNKPSAGEFTVMKTVIRFSVAPTKFPQPTKKDPIYTWTPPSVMMKGEALTTKEQLLDFCDTLMHGRQHEYPGGKSKPLSITEGNKVDEIIKQIYQCYDKMTPATAEQPGLQTGIIHYQVKDFFTAITLRLNKEGELAFKWDYGKDDPFQIQLHLSVKQQAGEPIVHIKVFPPDFLTGGALYEALLDAVFNEKIGLHENEDWGESSEEEEKEEKRRKNKTPFEVLKENFSEANPNDKQYEKLVQEIFDQCREEGAFIFRIKRKKNVDVNLFILMGKMKTDGDRDVLVFQGKFKVNFQEGVPSVKLRKSSLKVLYDKEYTPIKHKGQVRNYFEELPQVLKNCLDLID